MFWEKKEMEQKRRSGEWGQGHRKDRSTFPLGIWWKGGDVDKRTAAVRRGGGRVGICASLLTENKPDSSRLLLEGESVGSSAMTLTLSSESPFISNYHHCHHWARAKAEENCIQPSTLTQSPNGAIF